jgi:2-iminobutanoate/2-iminopropanoate deaminase
MSKRQVVHTDRAPKAIGPYSQAVIANGFVFCSGQIALEPATGQIAAGGIREQTEQALANLRAVLEAAGSGFDRVVRSTIYLRSMSDFAVVNEVYAKCFPSDPPARATVAVSGLPRDVMVEIDMIATCG